MTIQSHNTLLLTGAAGGLGKALRERLKANCKVLRLSDIQAFGEAGAAEEIMLADLADAAAVDAMVRGVPLGRIGMPDDYAGMVAFLASDDGGFITGQTISISGGLTMHG